MPQYWVTFAFLTVFESAVNAVYWFRKYSQIVCMIRNWRPQPSTTPSSLSLSSGCLFPRLRM